MSMRLLSTTFGLLFLSASASASTLAQNKCRSDLIESSYGTVEHISCRDQARNYTHTIRFSGADLLRDSLLVEVENSKDRGKWVLRAGAVPTTGCPERLYLIDLSLSPVKVIAFGVKNACNEFHWASWGTKRSVIAIKNNVKFVYEDGKLTPPARAAAIEAPLEVPR